MNLGDRFAKYTNNMAFLKVNPQSLQGCTYGCSETQESYHPTGEEILQAYNNGEFDDRVMDIANSQVQFEALAAFKNVWKTYHARRVAYWMREIKNNPNSWQNNDRYPIRVGNNNQVTAGNHRVIAAKILGLSEIEVEGE